MFLSRNKKNNVYPYKPQFYYIKLELKGVKIIQACFRDASIIDTYSEGAWLADNQCHGVGEPLVH